jgi:hypothetical protein
MKKRLIASWLIYHVENGKLVVTKADHMAHLKQAKKAAGAPKVNPIAATLEPLVGAELEALEKKYGVTLDSATPQSIPAYVPVAAPKRILTPRQHAALSKGGS